MNGDVEMRNFDYSKKWEKLLTPEIVALLTQIHEYKGEQSLFIEDYYASKKSSEI